VKPPPFDYLAPSTIGEAVAALASSGGDGKALAGGQSLVPLLAFRLVRPAVLVDLNRVEELVGVRVLEGGGLELGAMTRTHELETSPLVAERWPLARLAAPLIGHRQIRNRGTVGGSLAHADPAAELPAVTVASDATLVVEGPGGTREVAAAEFFTSVFTTALEPDELLTAIRIPPPRTGLGTAFVEVSRRHGDFALAGAAASVSLEDDRCVEAALVLSGVDATPVAIPTSTLAGSTVTTADAKQVGEEARRIVDPGSDQHASAEYRRELAAVVAGRALLAAAERARASQTESPKRRSALP
jgi:CO/xanthine dehydrogenase FAD-binding subunit